MADDELSVRFSGDISALQTSVGQAKDLVSSFGTSVRSAASVATSAMQSIVQTFDPITSGLKQIGSASEGTNWKVYAAGAAAATAAVIGLSEANDKASASTASMSKTISDSVSSVFRAVSSDGSISSGVLNALTLGYAALARQALATAASVEQSVQAMAAVGNAATLSAQTVSNGYAVANATLMQFLATLQTIPGVTQADASAIQGTLGQVQNYSVELNEVLVQVVAQLTKNSTEAKELASELKTVFSDPSSQGLAFIQTLTNMNASLAAEFRAAQQSGSVNRMNGVILDALTVKYRNVASEATRATQEQIQNATAFQGASQGAQRFIDLLTASLQKQQAVIDTNAQKIQSFARSISTAVETPQQIGDAAGKIVSQVNPISDQIDKVSSKIKALNADLERLQRPSNVGSNALLDPDAIAAGIDKDKEAIAQLQQKLTDLKNTAAGGSPVQIVDLTNAQKAVQAGEDQLRDAKAILGATQAMAAQATDLTTKTQLTTQAAQQELHIRQQELDLIKARNGLTKAGSDATDAQAGLAEAKANQAAINQTYAAGTQQRIEAQTAVLNAQKAVDRESEQDQADSENQKYQNAKNAIDAQIALIKQQANEGEISRRTELTQLTSALDQETALEKSHQEKIKEIWDEGTSQYRNAVTQLATIDSQAATRRIEATRQVNQEIANDYKRSFEQIGSSISSNIMQMIQGQEKFGDAVKSIAVSIVSSFVSAGVKMVADWLARQAAMVAASVTSQTAQTAAAAAGEAARTGIAATGAAAQETSILSSMITVIGADVKATIAGVTAFLAPILGPAAPAAGAAAGAGVAALAAFDIGAYQIPNDQIAMVHKNELVMPSAEAGAFRSMLSGMASGGSGGTGGGDTHNHFSPTVHFHNNGGGMSARDMEGHADTLMKILKKEYKRMNGTLR